MKRYELIIVGAGPAGLSAAIEAAKRNMQVVVFDENSRPGGQLFKQIHKFFGSKEHKAKTRGFIIGEELLVQAKELGVEVILNATVIGLYREKEVCVMQDGLCCGRRGDDAYIPRLDAAGRNRRRCGPTDDEPSWSKTWRTHSYGGIR